LKQLLSGEPAEHIGPPFWTLRFVFAEAGAGPKFLTEQYQALQRPLPNHWARRFELERELAARDELERSLAELRRQTERQDASAVRALLAHLKPLLAARPALDAADLELLGRAEQLTARLQVRRLVFQAGKDAAPGAGVLLAVPLSDGAADPAPGLLLGRHGGTRRLLLQAEGLGETLAKARVSKATLELAQLHYSGPGRPQVALFRVSKPWFPGAVNWKETGMAKSPSNPLPPEAANWSVAGATGAEDCGSDPEAVVTLDGRNLLRSWDVTAYVREVAEGKAPNRGLLARIVNQEPVHELRFHSEATPEAQRDPALRPRLVVEAEMMGP
jgi:hypothetical protein